MQNNKQPSQAAGSNKHRRQQPRDAVSASQPQGSNERPPASPYGFESEERQANSHQSSQHSQTPSRRMSAHSATHQPSEYPNADATSTTQDRLSSKQNIDTISEWSLLEREDSSTQSYTFPGTWTAALQDTTAALTQVGSATASYALALTNSGIGKASWSVGTAFASTANKSALSFVGWAADRTGTAANQLPRPVGGWLKRGKERARAKIQRREEGALEGVVLETADMDSTGEIVGPMRAVYKGMATEEEKEKEEEDEWEVAITEGGGGWKGKEKEEPGDDEEGNGGGQKGDGLVRLFQFDD